MENYHISINDEFEECYYEGSVVLEIKAHNLQQALEKFVAHFSESDVVDFEKEPNGSAMVYTRTKAWTFVQRFCCPHVWGLLQVSAWEPEYENEWGERCYGFTQNEYDSILETRDAENALRRQINTYLGW